METTHLNAPRSVLFIGNSYTYCNDLPSLFGELARSRGYELQVRSVTKGGHTLEGHADPADECGAKLEALLQSERFDAVFLQEFSVRPALDDKTPFFNAVRTLCARLRRTGDVRILLYQTWGRKEPCETLDAHGWTNREMTLRKDCSRAGLSRLPRRHGVLRRPYAPPRNRAVHGGLLAPVPDGQLSGRALPFRIAVRRFAARRRLCARRRGFGGSHPAPAGRGGSRLRPVDRDRRIPAVRSRASLS